MTCRHQWRRFEPRHVISGQRLARAGIVDFIVTCKKCRHWAVARADLLTRRIRIGATHGGVRS